jgi:hypothetical protein
MLKDWVKGPWDTRRISRAGFRAALFVALAWALWRITPRLRLNLRAWSREKGFDPVRHEAGQWLRRVNARGGAQLEAVAGELRRLRYGHRASWPAQPHGIFRQAKRELRTAKG